MSNRFSSGKYSIAMCDRCGQKFSLKELRTQTLKTKPYKIKVCRPCYEPDHPQLKLGMYPVFDPQAVREPRPDTSYQQAGTTGMQTNGLGDESIFGYGYPSGGSRVFQWGWAPVGGAGYVAAGLTPNYLVLTASVGTVTVTTV